MSYADEQLRGLQKMAPQITPARIASGSLLRLQSDARLAALARDGHGTGFDVLVSRYRDELVRASARIVGADRAEDVVQQALLNAHQAIDTTDSVKNIRAWLHKINHNAALNVLRAVRDEAPLDPSALADARSASPADAAELGERLRETLAAIDELPANQRAALLLRELEGRSHEDIAAALDITPGAARQALMRGRRHVRAVVSALTPYPLIVKLAGAGSSPAAAGVAELIGGAGASAAVMKLGATVAATGALAGGVVGTEVAIKHERRDASAAAATPAPRAPQAPPAATRQQAPGATRAASDDGRGSDGRDGHSGRRPHVDGRFNSDSRGSGGPRSAGGKSRRGHDGRDRPSDAGSASFGQRRGQTPESSGPRARGQGESGRSRRGARRDGSAGRHSEGSRGSGVDGDRSSDRSGSRRSGGS